MRLLVIGGTRFIGRHIVETAVAGGHEVTVFHRGIHAAPLGRDVRVVLGDRNGDLAPLREATGPAPHWDAVVDTCAYFPDQVEGVGAVLDNHTDAYVLISTVSVYDDPPPNHNEQAPLRGDHWGDDYGALKVRCEAAALKHFGPRCLVVRPAYVVGPHDYSWRFPWWVTRLARGGAVLAPGPAGAPIQLLDGRDLAAWIIAALDQGQRGTYHTAGPAAPMTFGGLLETVASVVAPAGTELVWVDASFLTRRGLSARELPLWARPDDAGHTRWADPGAAVRAGLRLRPLTETVADTLRWARTVNRDAGTVGIDSGHEQALLRNWAAAGTEI